MAVRFIPITQEMHDMATGLVEQLPGNTLAEALGGLPVGGYIVLGLPADFIPSED